MKQWLAMTLLSAEMTLSPYSYYEQPLPVWGGRGERERGREEEREREHIANIMCKDADVLISGV